MTSVYILQYLQNCLASLHSTNLYVIKKLISVNLPELLFYVSCFSICYHSVGWFNETVCFQIGPSIWQRSSPRHILHYKAEKEYDIIEVLENNEENNDNRTLLGNILKTKRDWI